MKQYIILPDITCDLSKEIRKDFENTFIESHRVIKKDINVGFLNSLWQAVLRMFAPLL